MKKGGLGSKVNSAEDLATQAERREDHKLLLQEQLDALERALQKSSGPETYSLCDRIVASFHVHHILIDLLHSYTAEYMEMVAIAEEKKLIEENNHRCYPRQILLETHASCII